ncbi:Mitochondrial import inner membrane translocase subunit Tim21 [Galemys pyrenaicus]|uniref:Mitochondrial import inner membrane translocase subunit Tim21 n=1 Tax=Galemys pyrenaicus TaxID=202257 RepID=A0A8J5Z8D7_GALPY|nr:Mitochondrial import inner membrane translocase subunit Tim21 [Galemys pyrenaicus]
MICTFLRLVQYTEKLHRSLGSRWFSSRLVLKAHLKTEPTLTWGLREQKKTLRPRYILAVTQKTIWTRSARRAEEDSSKQVSVHRGQSEETVISTSQKGKTEFSSSDQAFTDLTRAASGPGPHLLRPTAAASPPEPGSLERSWTRPHLLGSGAHWNQHYRLKRSKYNTPAKFFDLPFVSVSLCFIFSFLCGLFYAIFKELFSSSSPNKIYGKALDMCRVHPEVISVFGEPVKGFGETTRRGRRQHVSFLEYSKDGLKHMRVKFYIQGSEPGRQGTVHLEVKENPESGEYEFRYIFVEVDAYPGRTIVVEDNRS